MASTYPGTKDNFATNHTDSENMQTVHAAVHNDLADAINKIENELGTNPKGTFADVAAKLNRESVIPFSRSGSLAVAVGQGRFVFPFAATITGVRASVGTAPVGSSLIVDINKNGTTIFSTQANRPTIAASGNVSGVAVPNTTSFAAGDYMTVDVDQVGSTTPGSDLTVVVTYTRN